MDGMLRGHALALLLLASAASGGGTGSADALILVGQGFAGQMRLGSASWAIGEGSWACSANPALTSPGFAASGGRWNLDATSASAACALSLGGSASAGLALRYLGHGGIVERDESGQVTGEYTWSSGMLGAGGSFEILPRVRGGIAAGPVWEKAGDTDASGFHASAGAAWSPSGELLAGIALRNVGSAPSWGGIHKNMPTELAAGASMRLPAGFRAVVGGAWGFWTASRAGAACEYGRDGLAVSIGWEAAGDGGSAGGAFGGVEYTFEQGASYSACISFRQHAELSWPVLAGLSIAF
jgi:hypothetical protein